MNKHLIRPCPSSNNLPKEQQLAWLLASSASSTGPASEDCASMAVNRVIDNAGVAIAAINRAPVMTARAQAQAHPRNPGATIFGLGSDQRFSAEWAAWANGTAVRELDMHDTFLAADYAHPADSIPPLLAVAQQLNLGGNDLLRGIIAAYEVHVALVKGICLHRYKKDHIAHLCPAQAAGLGAMLKLDTDTIYQAIQQAVHVSFNTRQSRKGEISSWKAYAPAHSGKLAIEAVDRAMRGEKSPCPIYEGEDSVIAWMLGGPEDCYEVLLPEKGEPRKAILETYTKEHSAEYQAQALIDLAFSLRSRISDMESIERITIHTSHHTHFVIGTGSGDPQKFDPAASRETLDHSIMYIFAVALQDGVWHHVDSYTPERAAREDVLRLWKKIETREDPEWTMRYHSDDAGQKAFGGRVEVVFKDGSSLTDELAVADAHALGRRPFQRTQYIEKFKRLTSGILPESESARFLQACADLPTLPSGRLDELNIVLPPESLRTNSRRGIF